MAQHTFEVGAVGNYDAWALGAGGDKVVAVNSPDDDDTTYISELNNTDRESYTLDLTGKPAMATITQVDILMRARGTNASAGQIIGFLRLGGTDADQASNAFGTSYADFEWTNISRPGGGSWTPSDLDTLEVGAIKNVDTTGGGNTGRVTTLQVRVTYTPPVGGFMFLIG